MNGQQEIAAAGGRLERHMAEAAISPAAWPLPGGYRPVLAVGYGVNEGAVMTGDEAEAAAARWRAMVAELNPGATVCGGELL